MRHWRMAKLLQPDLTYFARSETNPLRKIKDSKKLLITPHVAWASVEARTKLMGIILGQVKEYFQI